MPHPSELRPSASASARHPSELLARRAIPTPVARQGVLPGFSNPRQRSKLEKRDPAVRNETGPLEERKSLGGTPPTRHQDAASDGRGRMRNTPPPGDPIAPERVEWTRNPKNVAMTSRSRASAIPALAASFLPG